MSRMLLGLSSVAAIVMVLVGCGGGGKAKGSVVVIATWEDDNVVVLRVTATGADMNPVIEEAEGVSSPTEIKVDGIPPGSGRTITVEGLDAAGRVTNLGRRENLLVVVSGQVPVIAIPLVPVDDVGKDEDQDGFTVLNGDCVDTDPQIYPGAVEICGDQVDQDCDGVDLPCDDMVFIDGGCFLMGDEISAGGSDELPVHEVCLDGFFMDIFEVTQAQYEHVTGENPAINSGDGELPVEWVSWFEARDFCSRVGKRLPTEAEWEYAARGGGQEVTWAGTSEETDLQNFAWYSANTTSTQPVGQKTANSSGLFDLSGNIAEWVADWYGSTYYASSPRDNPGGPSSGTERVFRGGSWFDGSSAARCAARGNTRPGAVSNAIGFRCARSL